MLLLLSVSLGLAMSLAEFKTGGYLDEQREGRHLQWKVQSKIPHHHQHQHQSVPLILSLAFQSGTYFLQILISYLMALSAPEGSEISLVHLHITGI